MTPPLDRPSAVLLLLDRPSAVLLLLDSMLDYLPGIRSATGQLAASGGAAVGTVVSCGNCNGSGRALAERIDTGAYRKVACALCGGTGSRQARKGEAGSDPMIDRSSGKLAAIKGRGMERAELDSEIARLERTRIERSGERSGRDAYGWERERQAQAKAGSYRELEAALEWLRQRSAARASRAWQYAYHWHAGWSQDVWATFGETLEMLAVQMPDRIKVPEAILEHGGPAIHAAIGRWTDPLVLASRDEKIRMEREAGATLTSIGRRWNLTHQRISQIVSTATTGKL